MTRVTGLGAALLTVASMLLVGTAIGAVALWRQDHETVVMVTLAQAVVYAIAVFLIVRRADAADSSSKRALVVIVFIGLLMRLPLLPSPPVSTDLWRYIWDGRVQAAGINPYLHLPTDPALNHLRDDTVFRQINRPDYAPTIYPPTAQVVFFLASRLGESAVIMKATMVAFEGLALWALLQLLSARGLPATRILIYAWHPLAAWEFAGSAHVDAVGIAFMLLAFVAADRGSPLLAGASLAAGSFVKYFPVITGSTIYRRWDWRLPTAFLLTAVVLYAPYIGAGAKVIGYLLGYVAEEGFADGSGIFLWLLFTRLVAAPASAAAYYMPAAAAVLIALALVLFFRRQHRGADLAAAMILATTALVLMSPHYPWYFAWLIPFLCFHPLVAVLYLTGASSYLYLVGGPLTLPDMAVVYGPFVVLLIAEAIWRHFHKIDTT